MTDTATLKKQIGLQATRLAECIRKINQLTSELHHSQEENKRLRGAMAYAHQLEDCVAEFLDAYTAFNNDELDEVSMNDVEHGMKLAMRAFRDVRAAVNKIRAGVKEGDVDA